MAPRTTWKLTRNRALGRVVKSGLVAQDIALSTEAPQRMGISQTTLSALLSGRARWTIDYLMQAEMLLGRPASELMADAERLVSAEQEPAA